MISLPHLAFASPRKLPRAARLAGRVVVLDIAFASEGLGRGFAKTTGKFIDQLGPRLARWVDHHDHPLHTQFSEDPRFVLCKKSQHGACPEIITPELVADTGPIDTILAHFDLDGLYATAKWILGGKEPYPGADGDARAVDTRVGEIGPTGRLIDRALRAHYGDAVLKTRVVKYLIGGLQPGIERETIMSAAADQGRMNEESRRLADQFDLRGDIAFIVVARGNRPYDKTELLLLGQQIAAVSMVSESGNVTIAAPFDSGLDFVALLDLGGGMPTRVNVPDRRIDEALHLIQVAINARGVAPE